MARPARRFSDAAQQYRQVMWLMVLLGLLGFGLAFLAARTGGDRALGGLGILLGLIGTAAGAWSGLRARRQAIADRELESRRGMIVLLAAQLGAKDDAALERLAAGSGMAADAARLILQGRAEKAGRRPPG